VSQEKLETIIRGLQLLETFLTTSEYLAGDSLTIVDLCSGSVGSAVPFAF